MCGVKRVLNTGTLLLAALAVRVSAFAQTVDGNTGINQANTMVRSYYTAATNLMYAIGALVGIIGAIRVYNKWTHGDHDTGKVAAAWFSACIFLVVVATVIQSFFGL
jgi:hypothetical protein